MAAPMRSAARCLFVRGFQPNITRLQAQKVGSTLHRVRYLSYETFVGKHVPVRVFRLAGAVAAVVTGAATFTLVNKSVDAAEYPRPPPTLSRQIKNENDNTGLKLTLYQYQSCPFCCKLRAYLDYYGFSYDVVEVNSVSRKQIKWSKYKKVPILVVDGQGEDGYVQLNDSSVIISILESFLVDPKVPFERLLSYYPTIKSKDDKGKEKLECPNKYFIMYGEKKAKCTKEEYEKERKWRFWVDDHMVHVISPNLYRTVSESLEAFRHFSEVGDWERQFSAIERYTVIGVGAAAMYVIGRVLKKRHNLKPDVRESLYDACNQWMSSINENQIFNGGSQPNLADLAMYGAICSFEGCTSFHDMLKATDIGPWFEAMKNLVTIHQGSVHLAKLS